MITQIRKVINLLITQYEKLMAKEGVLGTLARAGSKLAYYTVYGFVGFMILDIIFCFARQYIATSPLCITACTLIIATLLTVCRAMLLQGAKIETGKKNHILNSNNALKSFIIYFTIIFFVYSLQLLSIKISYWIMSIPFDVGSHLFNLSVFIPYVLIYMGLMEIMTVFTKVRVL